MSSRRNRQEPPDELDWLVSDALHAMVRAVEPSPRVWLTIRAAAMAQPQRRGARACSAFRAVMGHLSSWLAAGETNQALGGMVHQVHFADVGAVSPRMVWWFDVKAGPFSSDWQTCMIVA
jgi:hypothetical protein